MPLPGGPADKAGNRFELKWVVRQFLRILAGEVDWIHLEPPDAQNEGIEFRVHTNSGLTEVHQAKRQASSTGVWTIPALRDNGVLASLKKQALDNGFTFVFASMESVRHLRELVERAQQSESLESFRSQFLTPALAGAFDTFLSSIELDTPEAGFLALQRFSISVIEERELTSLTSSVLSRFIDGNPEAAFSTLAVWALENTHRTINADDIWARLTTAGFRPSNIEGDANVVAQINLKTDGYLHSQKSDVAGQHIVRREADEVLTALSGESNTRTVFLLGAAGTGKTSVAMQVVRAVRDRGWPVIAFRLDRFESIATPEAIGNHLFNRAKSPIAVLATISAERECLVVIDQLDAVSTISGRHSKTFDVVAELIRAAHTYRQMRILIVCRKFDLENDYRLRELHASEKQRSETIEVSLLTLAEVKETLVKIGTAPDQFTDRQLELLRLPLHLALVTSVCVSNDGKLQFNTPADLYAEFWRQKRTDLAPKLSDQNNFDVILEAICERISHRQSLSVPSSIVQRWNADVDCLVSGNVLAKQGGQIAFFHEGFFDYVFARTFCNTDQRLWQFILGSRQDLFIRSQVRQIVSFRRDQDFSLYLEEITCCLKEPEIRFHLKTLILLVLGQTTTPSDEEWKVYSDALSSSIQGIAESARQALWSSTHWFRYLCDKGILTEWLTEPEAAQNQFALNLLTRHSRHAPNRAAEVMAPLIGFSTQLDQQIGYAIARSDGIEQCARLEEIFRLIVARCSGDLTLQAALLSELVEFQYMQHPRVACRAIGMYLASMNTSDLAAKSFAGMSSSHGIISSYIILRLVDNAPFEFAESVTRPILDILDLVLIRREYPEPFPDEIWRNGFRNFEHSAPETLISKWASALRKTASENVEKFELLIRQLIAHPARTAHAVLLRALPFDGARSKSFTMSYLVDHWSRYGIWYDEFSLWDARTLLIALSPYLTIDDVEKLESLITSHFEEWKGNKYQDESESPADRLARLRQRAGWHRESLGRRQFVLLSALPLDLMSPNGKRRLRELERKFADEPLEKPISVWGGFVQSPLPQRAVEKMTDIQWLSAIQRYATDDARQRLPNAILGGASQLAQALEKCVADDPERFARLMLWFPDDSHEDYFSHVIMGLRKPGLPMDLLVEVCRRAHNRPKRPHGRWLVSLIASNCEQTLPSELLEMVAWYALNDSDPDHDIWRTKAPGGSTFYGGDPRFHGINTARGGAALAIAQLVGEDTRYWDYFAETAERLVADPTISVRVCVAEICTQALRYDRPRAISLFERLCDCSDEILAADSIEEFLHYTGVDDFLLVRPILERMLRSQVSNAQQAGARQSCLAALFKIEAKSLAETTLAGNDAMRRGAAQVYAHNIFESQHFEDCHKPLIAMFDDPNEETRAAASEWMWKVQDAGRLKSALPVAETYVTSQAFLDNPERFFMMLDKLTDAPPSLLFSAGTRFLEHFGKDAGDLRKRAAMASHSLSKLILRAYQQSEDDLELRARCLDLFDSFLATGGYGADEVLDRYER